MAQKRRTVINADEEFIVQGTLIIEGDLIQKQTVTNVIVTQQTFESDVLIINSDGVDTSNNTTNAAISLRSGNDYANITFYESNNRLVFGNAVMEGTFAGNIGGGAAEADALSSAVTIVLSGDATGSNTFINAGDTTTIPLTLANTGVSASTYGTTSGNTYPRITTDLKGRLTAVTDVLIDIPASQVNDFNTAVSAYITNGYGISEVTGAIAIDTSQTMDLANAQTVTGTKTFSNTVVISAGQKIQSSSSASSNLDLDDDANVANSVTLSGLTNINMVLDSSNTSTGDSFNVFNHDVSSMPVFTVTEAGRTFSNDLHLYATSNQIVLEAGGSSQTTISTAATSNVTITFPDASGTVALATEVSGLLLELATDSANSNVELSSQTLTVTGGTGIDTSVTGQELTVGVDSTVLRTTSNQSVVGKIDILANTDATFALQVTNDFNSFGDSTISTGPVIAEFTGNRSQPKLELRSFNPADYSLVTSGAINNGIAFNSDAEGVHLVANNTSHVKVQEGIVEISDATLLLTASNITATGGTVNFVSDDTQTTGSTITANVIFDANGGRTTVEHSASGASTSATGTVEITSTVAFGGVDSITVDGVEIMSGQEGSIGSDVAAHATQVADNITAFTSAPNYTATSDGGVITITSVTTGDSVNGFTVVSTVSGGTTKVDTNMSGGTSGGGNVIITLPDSSGNVALTTDATLSTSGDTGTGSLVLANSTLSFTGGDGLATTASTTDITIDVDSTVVRTSGDQTISGVKTYNGTVDLSSATVPGFTVNGNLEVLGNINAQSITDSFIEDITITLNSNASVNATSQIVVNRPTATSTSLRWNESTDIWEFTNDGSTYQPIADTTTALSEGTNLYFTTSRARDSISVTDSGGDGSLSYSNVSGVITYTGPSAAETRAHFAGGDGIDLTTGTIAVDTTVVRTSGDQTISGVKTYNGNVDLSGAVVTGHRIGGTGTSLASSTGLDIQDGGIALVLGADLLSSNRTDATIKEGRIGFAHYTNAEEPLGFVHSYSSANISSIRFGASSFFNTPTLFEFHTAANITSTSSNLVLTIDNDNLITNIPIKITSASNQLTIVGTSGNTIITDSATAERTLTLPNASGTVATQEYVTSSVGAVTLNASADSGTAAVDLDAVTLQLTGGSGITTSASGNAATFAVDGTVIRTTTNQSLAGTKTFTGELILPTAASTTNNSIRVNTVDESASIRINGTDFVITPVGISGTLETPADATGGINLYAGTRGPVANVSYFGIKQIDEGAGISVTETANVVTVTGRSDANVRGLFSAVDNAGDGSFSYNDTTGVFTYSGITAAQVRANFSGTGLIDYNDSTGVISTTADHYNQWTVITDSGGGSANNVTANGTVSIVGGTNISVTNVGNVITIRNDNVADMESVTAGDGLTGGGNSGNVTLNVGAGYGISVAADLVSINTSQTMDLSNTQTVSAIKTFNAGLISNANVTISGHLSATTKSFVIDHPTKPGHKLHHGSLEGPEHAVYVRGKLNGTNEIIVPDYWEGLVDPETITVNLTPIGKQQVWIESIDGLDIKVGSDSDVINCFYTVWAERKDIASLEVEYKDIDK